MAKFSSRERVLAALRHEESDRVPIDFGGTTATTIVIPAYEKLKQFLGLKHETRLRAARAQTVLPDDSLLDYFHIDTRAMVLGDFSSGRSREIRLDAFVDAWGTTWEKAPDGHFINVDGPFQKIEPNINTLESHAWPNPEDPNLYLGLGEQAEFLRKTTDRALILNLPLGVIHQCQFLRGFSEWLIDLVSNPEFAKRMMDIVCDLWIRIAEKALDAVGSNVDVVEWGDDVAIQDSLMFSPDMYRKYIKPHHCRMIRAIKSRTDAKVLYHSCGAVFPLIDDFIEIGVDALNPVQVSARGMDPQVLKERFGDRITFWGGIDTHHILPNGSPQDVREEVQRIVRLFGKGGGYVLASVHNIQNDVPPENVVEMLQAAAKAGVS
jgi:uroporphyrinogen decarboxylase